MVKWLKENFNVMPGFIVPAFVMLIKSLSGYEISDYANIWLPLMVFGLIIFFTLFKFCVNNALPVKGQIVFMAITGLLYGYGSTIQVNCVFDKSEPQLVHTSINSKWIEHSKGTFYHFKLNSWDLDGKPKDIEVSKSTFNKYSEGDGINVELKKGLIGIPWYYLPEEY